MKVSGLHFIFLLCAEIFRVIIIAQNDTLTFSVNSLRVFVVVPVIDDHGFGENII